MSNEVKFPYKGKMYTATYDYEMYLEDVYCEGELHEDIENNEDTLIKFITETKIWGFSKQYSCDVNGGFEEFYTFQMLDILNIYEVCLVPKNGALYLYDLNKKPLDIGNNKKLVQNMLDEFKKMKFDNPIAKEIQAEIGRIRMNFLFDK
ncbi:hypothetical protein [Neobacillus soli]|uniref:hypothetical protein n=1 Tax=Neobacillus soli TaxID=220688 RepID=UPI000826C9B0|nr:hypothetical protein [Neobacillus soli]